MKRYRANSGPFPERTYYTDEEIEKTCTAALLKIGLLPEKPCPIRIDRFVEKRFSVTPEYGDLPEGVLGLTMFGPKGVQGIVISRRLDEEASGVAERRIRTTLAHEAGHGLFHTQLIVTARQERPLFCDFSDPMAPKVLCRDLPNASGSFRSGYDGRWWEFQANRAIGPLLMPANLVRLALAPFLEVVGSFGTESLPKHRRAEAVRMLADSFEVNPVVARIRLADLNPLQSAAQLQL